MENGFMVLDVELPGNRAVALEGSCATYWVGEGLPVYKGPIAGLPESVLSELSALGAIKAR